MQLTDWLLVEVALLLIGLRARNYSIVYHGPWDKDLKKIISRKQSQSGEQVQCQHR
jgi:hypothetical protein